MNNATRRQLLELIEAEVDLVKAKAGSTAEQHWENAEQAVAKELGYGDSLVRAEYLRNEIKGMQTELARLEEQMVERSQRATKDDYLLAGIEVSSNEYGQVRGPLPKVFTHEIRSVWDVKVISHLNEHLNFFSIWHQVRQLYHSVRREMLLAGTYEDARAVYQRFHEYVRAAVGEDVPGLMAQLDALPALRAPEQKS
jgi:hypothetical protein